MIRTLVRHLASRMPSHLEALGTKYLPLLRCARSEGERSISRPSATIVSSTEVHFCHTVRRSVMTRMILPAPAISTSFSCQLRSTLIAWPPPSPALRDWIWENPVVCGESPRDEPEDVWDVCDIPL